MCDVTRTQELRYLRILVAIPNFFGSETLRIAPIVAILGNFYRQQLNLLHWYLPRNWHESMGFPSMASSSLPLFYFPPVAGRVRETRDENRSCGAGQRSFCRPASMWCQSMAVFV